MRLLAIVSLLCCGALAGAGEIESAQVEHEGGDYRLRLIMRVDADKQDLLALLTDHENFHQLSEVMSESGLVDNAPEGRVRRRVVVETCILLFCFKVVIVEDVELLSAGGVRASMVPAQSDFSYGRMEWQIAQLGSGRSEIAYSFDFRPDFWVPPAIGPFILKRKMIREAQESILKMENLAGNAPAN